MPARFYKLGDAGAPALFYTTATGTVNAERFDNFKRVLKACLVNGYGSLPAAGWTLVHEVERSITLRNAAGRYVTLSSLYTFLQSTALQDNFCRVYLHNTFTGLVDGVPQGEGVVSGVAAGSSLPQVVGQPYWGFYAATTRWAVLADENSFYFMLFGTSYSSPTNGSISNFNLDSGSEGGTLYVGEDDRGNFIAVGGAPYLSGGSGYPTSAVTFDGLTLTTLHNPLTGLLIDTGGAANTRVVGLRGAQSLYTDPYTRDWFSLNPVEWVCNNQVVGALRGGFSDLPHGQSYASTILQALFGAPATATVEHWLTPVTLADGYSYMLAPSNRTSGLAKKCFVTDNPALW